MFFYFNKSDAIYDTQAQGRLPPLFKATTFPPLCFIVQRVFGEWGRVCPEPSYGALESFALHHIKE